MWVHPQELFLDPGLLQNEYNRICNYGLSNILFVRDGYYNDVINKPEYEGTYLLLGGKQEEVTLYFEEEPITNRIHPVHSSYDSISVHIGNPNRIYWKDGIERTTLADNEVIIPINSIYYKDIGTIGSLQDHHRNRIRELAEAFADEHFAEIETDWKSKKFYIEFLLTCNSNPYHEGYDKNYFENVAFEEVFNEIYFPLFQDVKVLSGIEGGPNELLFRKNVEVVGFYDYTQFRDSYGTPFICSKKFFENYISVIKGDFAFVITSLKYDLKSDLNLIRFGTEELDSENFLIENDITVQIEFLNDTLSGIANIFIYVGLVLALFASGLLFSFISGNILYRKREIGVLRSIGASGRDVLKIFLYEGLIISLINFLLATISSIILCIIINQNLRAELDLLISFLIPGVRQVILLLVISVCVALFSSFFPIHRFAQKKPIDVIKDL